MKHPDFKGIDAPGTGFVRRALGGHTAIGLVACALLYLVCLTGMLAVFGARWERWEQPQAPEMQAMSPQAVQRAVDSAMRTEATPPAYIALQMPSPANPRTTLTGSGEPHYVTPAGSLAGEQADPWTSFMLDMHYYLNLPGTWGIMLTGALGAMMAAASLTGVLAHPRILRDAFRFRAKGREDGAAMTQLAQADLHNRMGTWLLPFIMALAITGAMLGLGQIVFQSIATERYGGQIAKSYASLYGSPAVPDATRASGPRVDVAMGWLARNRPQNTLNYITIEAPGTKGQRIALLTLNDKNLSYGDTYRFDGTGHYTDDVGISDGPKGQQALSSIYKIHFGTFGGVPVLVAWFLFGLALCAIVVTGTNIWLTKRARRGHPAPRIEAMWAIVVWGSPILLIATYWLRLVAGGSAPLAIAFWSALVFAMAVAAIRPIARLAAYLRMALAAAMIPTGLGHALLSGQWPSSSAIIDLCLIGGGLILAAPALRHRVRRTGSTSPASLDAAGRALGA
ncbi:PepSY-associated TM helix domain-containing protein [Novosphingobium sp. 9]|uniref:PepSY-associated TM helix domain-containing protein n=1 Tax=Novosphingobium sp. 9 TaxID=2025349 RepID=UPI0021B5AE40|nr:PepSY-associated TM helix domain-containing protein [Novosphingobium sp. 9]